MNLIAKVDDQWNIQNRDILDQIDCSKSIEIQMIGSDLIESYNRCKELLYKLCSTVKLEYVVLHTPIRIHEIEYIVANNKLRTEFENMLDQVVNLSKELNLKMDVLVHITDLYDQVKGLNIQSYLINIANKLPKDSIGILLENNIRDFRLGDNEKTTLDLIFNDIDADNINICLDICHLRASEFCFDTEMSLSDSYIKKIKNIHFSATYNKEGYRNKTRTHGRFHRSLAEAMQDIAFLERKGVNISNKNIVLEINEDDYEHRPGLIKEIKIMKSIF